MNPVAHPIRRAMVALVVVLATLAAALSAVVHRDLAHTNDFIVLFYLELLIPLVAGPAALAYVVSHHDRAWPMLAVGLHVLVVGTALITAFPIWLPQDNTILGAALLGSLLVMIGSGLAVSSSLLARGVASSATTGAGLLVGFAALLVATAGGVIAPAAALRPQIILAVLVVLGVVALAGPSRRPLIAVLLVAALANGSAVAALLLRGPGDWASGSDTVKLYSFPIVVIVGAVSLLIIDLFPPTPSPDSPQTTIARGPGAAWPSR